MKLEKWYKTMRIKKKLVHLMIEIVLSTEYVENNVFCVLVSTYLILSLRR